MVSKTLARKAFLGASLIIGIAGVSSVQNSAQAKDDERYKFQKCTMANGKEGGECVADTAGGCTNKENCG